MPSMNPSPLVPLQGEEQCSKGAMPEKCNARTVRRPRGADDSDEGESKSVTDNGTDTEREGRQPCRHPERWIGR
jgi:hypothetical protein